MQCKGDIVVVDIKQHKSQFNNWNITITQWAKFFWHRVMVMFELLNCVPNFVAMATGVNQG